MFICNLSKPLEASVEDEQPPPYDYSIMANGDSGTPTSTTAPTTIIISTTANGYRDENLHPVA